MLKYLQLDELRKITSVQGQQNAEGTLLPKEVTDEQMEEIFMHNVVNGDLKISLVEYKYKKLQECSDKVSRNICFVKKTKKFEDIVTIFDETKNKLFSTKEEVDLAMKVIIEYLFD